MKLKKIRPVCSLVHGQVRWETKMTRHPPPKSASYFVSMILFVYHDSMSAVTPLLAQNNKYTRPPNIDVLPSTITSTF